MSVAKRFSWVILFILIIGCSHSVLSTKPNTTYLYNIPSIAQFLPQGETKNVKRTATTQEERVNPVRNSGGALNPTGIIIKPNPAAEQRGIISNGVNQLFEKIFKFDQELAIELGRLPEFQDGVNEREMLALENFLNFLSVSTDKEKAALGKILNIGKPEYRKFCSPLQALFWLAEKGELSKEKNPLENYSLEKLLDQAWAFEVEYTKEEAISIIKNWKDKERASRLLNESKDDIKRLNSKVNDFKKYLKRSSFEDRSIFKKYKGLDRWNDSNEVMDRLNSPELVEYWSWRNFDFDKSKIGMTSWITRVYPQAAEFTIKTKKGICFDLAYLTYECLKRSGYDVIGLNVYYKGKNSEGSIMHSVCILKIQESNKISYYKIGDSNTRSPNSMDGPFKSIEAIAERVAQFWGLQLKTYTTGLPLYDYDLAR